MSVSFGGLFSILLIASVFCFQVVEYGLFVKHYKVEVYLLELKLCESSDPDNVISCHFSKADTVGKWFSDTLTCALMLPLEILCALQNKNDVDKLERI